MNFRHNLNSITTRLVLLGLAIFIIGAVARTLVLSDYLRKDLSEQSGTQLLTLANYVANDIDKDIIERRNFLQRTAAKFPLAMLNDPRRTQDWLGERYAVNPIFGLGMSVFDASGRALANYPASADRAGISFSDRDYFQQAMKGEFSIGSPIIGRANKVALLPMAAPLRDNHGKVRAVLVGLTPLDNSGLLESLNRTRVGTGGGLLLISPRDKLVVGASDAKMILTATPNEGINLLHDRAMHGYRGTGITVNAFGTEELAGIASVPSSGWFVVARIPTSEAFKPMHRLRNLIVRSSAIIAPFILVVMFIGLRYMLKPLTKSAQHANQMSLGEIPLSPLQIIRDDEVGHMTKAFNRVLSKLIESSNELEQNQRKLQTTLEAVKKSEGLLSEAQTIANLGSYELDIGSGIWETSAVLDQLFGIDKAYERTTEGWAALLYPDDRLKMTDYFKNEVLGKLKPFDKEYRIIRQNDQEVRWVHGLGKLEFDDLGRPLNMRGTVQDITERKQAEQSLLITASVFASSQEAIMITDANNVIIDVNPAFTRITGYTHQDVIGKNPKLLSSGRQDSFFYSEMWKAIKKNKAWRGEIWNKHISGEIYAEQLSISAICDNNDRVLRYVGIFSDITHVKRHEAELSRVAHFDALTGIPNRVLLSDRMRQAISKIERDKNIMAVCYLDLDGFKPINDNLGHDAGDQVLVEIAKRIGNTIRGGDTVARLGGDEFVVLLLGIEKGEECVATLERLLAAISQPIIVKHKPCVISASIGVSLYPLDEEDPDTLLRHADQAMYQAKQSGKNRYHIYDPMLDQRAREHHEFLKSIRFGLENNQLELYYQPKVNLRTQELVGAEALIRWRHPQRGLLFPAEFLRYIENTELDIKIGEWVAATALAQINYWQSVGLDIEVSINISGYHLESSGFVEKLKQQLAQYPGIPSGKLQIEVLETIALNDIAIVRDIIESCCEFGVGFALDDFGTGYSSLSYLSGLPVDALKIDQSFVRDMIEDKGDMAIVQGIIALARAFDRQTVAEGIETEDHYRSLLDMGCEIGQGYFIAKPMPADQLRHWRIKSVTLYDIADRKNSL